MYEISRSGTTFDHNEYYINNLVLCSEHMYSKQYQLPLRKATNATEYFDVFFASARHSCQSLQHTQVNINCRASHAKKKKNVHTVPSYIESLYFVIQSNISEERKLKWYCFRLHAPKKMPFPKQKKKQKKQLTNDT